MASYIKFQWWNDTDLGDVLYQFGYKNRMSLNVEIEKPEYNTTIEAEQNGDNAEITKFRKWEKVRKFEIYMQEDLVDAFTFMAIHDNIEITLRTGEVLTVAKHTMRVEPSWEEIGCLAKCVISFTVDYVVAGSCNENMDLGCLCATSAGDFEYIIEYSSLTGEPDGTTVLAWTVADIAGKKYTAKRYQFSYAQSTWVELVTDQYACYENQDDGTTWIFDGQYWYLSPGFITSLVQPAGPGDNHVTVKGWVLPGAFCTVWYIDPILGNVDAGDYTADQLDVGISINPDQDGNCVVWLAVWNHSCDYKSTETASIVIT